MLIFSPWHLAEHSMAILWISWGNCYWEDLEKSSVLLRFLFGQIPTNSITEGSQHLLQAIHRQAIHNNHLIQLTLLGLAGLVSRQQFLLRTVPLCHHHLYHLTAKDPLHLKQTCMEEQDHTQKIPFKGVRPSALVTRAFAVASLGILVVCKVDLVQRIMICCRIY